MFHSKDQFEVKLGLEIEKSVAISLDSVELGP
jgi:hypothetical protein